jgi:isovaleryl-CoA dehydrogenase
VTIPEEYGGAGLDATAAVQVFDALSGSDPGFALAVLAHAVLFAQNLNVNGSETQKKQVLPRAVSGEWIGGLCMTEPEVGTDVLAMKTRARREGDAYVLDGRKTFITNGGVDERTLGDVFVVYAATGERSISAFLVEKGLDGFSLGQQWKDKLGMRASFTAELVFDGVRVPVVNRLGEEGEGTLAMMRNLEIERLTLAAMSVGIARRCVATMVEYANQRRSFGVPIREHGQVQRHIAESYAEYRAAASLVYDVCRPGRQARRRCRDPGAGRLRLHGRVRGGAALAGRQAARDRRRHPRGASPEPDQGSEPPREPLVPPVGVAINPGGGPRRRAGAPARPSARRPGGPLRRSPGCRP